MEDNGKIRVGITHGDINGVGYEVILKAFSDPTMFELCTPIVYGSPKVAAYHRKAMDLQTAFSIIATAEEAMDGRLNIMSCTEDELKVELTKPMPEAGKAALDALEADHDYLTAGGVFPEHLIKNFIANKRKECMQMAAIPHPAEFDRYYNL